MGCSPLREVETKEKAEALREMFPNAWDAAFPGVRDQGEGCSLRQRNVSNGECSPLRELETKAKAETLREMFPNGRLTYRS